MPKIFEESVQLGGSEQLENALILPISRHLAALLGSEVRVESKAGQGSTFRLLLPGRLPEGRAAS